MAKGDRDLAKERLWRERLAKQAGSGLNVRAFCRGEQLSENSFYAWRRTLRERDGQASSAKTAPSFVPAVVTREMAPPSITLELAGGHLLRLPESIGIERLVEFVAALEARARR